MTAYEWLVLAALCTIWGQVAKGQEGNDRDAVFAYVAGSVCAVGLLGTGVGWWP